MKKHVIKSKLLLIIALFLIVICSIIIYFRFYKNVTNDEKWRANVIEDTQNKTISYNSNIDFSSLETQFSKKYTLYDIEYPDFFRVEFDKNELNILVKDSAVDILLTNKMKLNANKFYSVDGITKNISNVFILPFISADYFPVMILKFEDNTLGYVNIEKAFSTGSFQYEKKLSSFKDIQSIINCNVSENDNTYVGIIAINSNNELFEITPEILNISK